MEKPNPVPTDTKPNLVPVDTKPKQTTSSSTSSSLPTKNNHQLFCEVIGIGPYPSTSNFTDASPTPKLNHKNPISLYTRVSKDLKHHTLQYWFVATLANSFLILQILLGATLAALGGTITTGLARVDNNRHAIAITVIGALQTVIGGLSTYFKSRNQPNRARQFRNALRKVKENIEEEEMRFRNPAYTADVATVVDVLIANYNSAVTDAEANYPDLWVRGGAQSTNNNNGGSGITTNVADHKNVETNTLP